MEKWTKKDFTIKGRFTGSRLLGHENDFEYRIYWNGKQMGDHTFSSKAKASAWLGAFLKKANAIRKMQMGAE